MSQTKSKDDNDILNKANNFATLICRYIIIGELVNLSQLHIGVGNSETEFSIDNPIIRLNFQGEQIPYIPGTTLKGIFRTEIERYLRSDKDYKNYDFEEICFPYENDSNCNKEDIKKICLACRIFGNSQVGSHINIMDAPLDTENYKFPGIKIKPGNAINRITGAAHKGQLYDIEALQPGGVFKFEMHIINIELLKDTIISRAIKFLLRQLKGRWIQVGAKRSTGFGQIELRNAKIIEILPENIHAIDFKGKKLESLIG